MRRGIAGAGMLGLVLAGGSPAGQEDVVLQAMRDELTRSMSKLGLKELKKLWASSKSSRPRMAWV